MFWILQLHQIANDVLVEIDDPLVQLWKRKPIHHVETVSAAPRIAVSVDIQYAERFLSTLGTGLIRRHYEVSYIERLFRHIVGLFNENSGSALCSCVRSPIARAEPDFDVRTPWQKHGTI